MAVPLKPGQSLVNFRLVEKIGEGGMGEVWKATDTTLDREVAIKVLPAAVSGDRERLARLEREAKALASLNHPNIAAIYGFPEGETRFLAMELVHGEDLAQVLARGPMPVRETLDAARQIAAGLEAAHEKGVVHRDLKPANVKRTPDGTIKVLDFGLAKTLGPAAVSSGQSATVTSAGSVAGLVLGTASYMSPEQARGLPVDRRTDLWAFGCLLYEMLSGVKAFDGATVTDVLAAVVSGEPDWGRLPAATPPAARRLLRRCLEKDARKRLRDAGDACLLLDDNPDDTRPVPVRGIAPTRSGAAVALAVVLGVAGLAGGWWLGHRDGDAASATELSLHRVTFARGMLRSARFAPDGRTIIYGASWGGPPVKLYLARTDSPESTPLPLPPAELLSVSKSGDVAVSLGHSYYGWMGAGTLARTSLLGGAPREILEHVRSADWSPDGSQFAVVRVVDGLDQLEYPVGKVLAKSSGYFEAVRVSPDGEHVAFDEHPSWGDNRGNIAMVDRAGKKTTLAADFAAIQGLAWAPGGKEIWFTATAGEGGSAIYAVDLGGRRRVVYSSVAHLELFDIAADGRVLLVAHRPERLAQALMAGDAEPRALVVPGESSIVRTISRDGRSVLVANQLPKEYETFVLRSDKPGAVRICEGEAGAISPDGASALSTSADYKTFFVTPLVMGSRRQVPNPDGLEYLSIGGWHPDGRHIVVVARRGSDTLRGYLIDIATGSSKAFGEPGVNWSLFSSPPISPDGAEVILHDASGVPKRWPIDGGPARPLPGILPDEQPLVYTEDGRGLFVARRALPIPIERIDLASGRRTPWLTLSPTDSAGVRYALATITPDGKHWTLNAAMLLSDLYLVSGLR